MADRNMSSGFSLDDILSETEKDTEKVPGKLWSLAEIDALLADEGLSESEKVQTEKAHEPKEQTEHAEKKYESAEEKNGKTPVLHTSKKEPDKKSDDSFSIDPAIFDEILSGGSRSEKTEGRKINAAKIEEDKKAFKKDDDSKKAAGVNNASSEILPENPLFGGTTPSLTSDNENSPVQSENKSHRILEHHREQFSPQFPHSSLPVSCNFFSIDQNFSVFDLCILRQQLHNTFAEHTFSAA